MFDVKVGGGDDGRALGCLCAVLHFIVSMAWVGFSCFVVYACAGGRMP